MNHVYFFGWPSDYGGADTKAAHLLDLLAGYLPITVVPNNDINLREKKWTTFLDELGIQYQSYRDLAPRLNGVGLALCNSAFFSHGLINIVKRTGLPIVWSSEMMWHHSFEKTFIELGFIDRLLYVSEIQKKSLNYEAFCDVSTRMTGNFVNPKFFPFRERDSDSTLVLGRLSRADPQKFPDDFPAFYESLGGEKVRFRVMAWDDQLSKKYDKHRFDERWEFLQKNEETSTEFLQSLDLFVYNLGPEVIESWGRSTVEAMLTGAIPLVPTGHNFGELIVDGESGFLCSDYFQYKEHVKELSCNARKRHAMSNACRLHAVQNLCNVDQHRAIWLEALDV